jgi:hypothetical protein
MWVPLRSSKGTTLSSRTAAAVTSMVCTEVSRQVVAGVIFWTTTGASRAPCLAASKKHAGRSVAELATCISSRRWPHQSGDTKVFSRAAQLRPLRCCPLLGFEHEVSCTNLRICAKLPRATYAEPLECSVPLNGGCGARHMQPGLRTDRPLAVSSMLAHRFNLYQSCRASMAALPSLASCGFSRSAGFSGHCGGDDSVLRFRALVAMTNWRGLRQPHALLPGNFPGLIGVF